MKLLFVKLKHIGDALLLTPTLKAARRAFPQATIWVVVRQGTEGILAGCPGIDRILTSASAEAANRGPFQWTQDLRLLRAIRKERFDYAFELTHGDRGRLLVGWSGALHRCASEGVYPLPWFWRPFMNRISVKDWSKSHQVQAGYDFVHEFLPLGGPVPELVFDRSRTAPAGLPVTPGNYVLIHPSTRWKRKQWPLDRWVELGQALLQRVPNLVLSTGPGAEEVEMGQSLAGRLGPAAIHTRGRLSWAQLAGLLYDARLFVGVDTAAMHLAAACGCPTVALFGASVATHWRPWQVRHLLVGDTLPPGGADGKGSMAEISTRQVVSACNELLQSPVR